MSNLLNKKYFTRLVLIVFQQWNLKIRLKSGVDMRPDTDPIIDNDFSILRFLWIRVTYIRYLFSNAYICFWKVIHLNKSIINLEEKRCSFEILWMKYAPLEIKQIACMSLDLKKSEKIVGVPGFDLWTFHTWGKHATSKPTPHHAMESKYRGYTLRIWQVSFILSCFKPVHMILNKKYNATQFSKKSRPS